MPKIDAEKSVDEFVALAEFIDHFNVHYQLLLRRYRRFKEIEDIYNTDIDVMTYLDIIIVQLRAMCIEKESNKKNYTAQILLRKLGKNELAEKLDAMLDEEFFEGLMDMSVRKALKILADQFICHYDNFDGGEGKEAWAMASIIEKGLRNPYHKHNLDYIMQTVMECIGEGVKQN